MLLDIEDRNFDHILLGIKGYCYVKKMVLNLDYCLVIMKGCYLALNVITMKVRKKENWLAHNLDSWLKRKKGFEMVLNMVQCLVKKKMY